MFLGLLAAGAPGFVTGIVLGGLLLCAGLSLGLWCAQHTQRQQRLQQLSADRVVELMSGMFHWADSLNNDVSQYRQTLEDMIHRIGEGESIEEDDAEELARQSKSVSQLLEHIHGANHHLQQRMQSAETTLKTQASEIAQYVCQTRTDDLTGLANRRSFDDILSGKFQQFSKTGKSLSALLIEIDWLDRLIVHHGQEAADKVLSQTATMLRKSIRSTDIAARYGEATYAVLMPEAIGAEAVLAAMRIAVVVKEAKLEFEGLPLNVTLSCGAAESLADDTAHSLMQRTHEALRASQQVDRTCTHLHNGRRCISLMAQDDSTDKPALTPSQERSPIEIPAQLQQSCDDLSKRYQEVARAESSS